MVLAACQGGGSSGRMSTKVVEVEQTIQAGSTTTIDRTTVTYNGSRIDQIAQVHNGAPAGTAKIGYGTGGIDRIDYTDKDGDRAIDQLMYANGQLARDRYEIMGVSVDEQTFTYLPERRDAVKEISLTHTPTGGTARSQLVKFEYDAEGRVTKRIDIDGSNTTTTEMRYTPDGLLERMTSFAGTSHLETYNFSYTSEGTVDEVVDSNNNRYEVSYDQSGRIAEIRYLANGTIITWRYTYGAGSADGWTFAPSLPGASFFDLGGNSYSTLSMLHGSISIPSDIPKATGGGGGGGGGGQVCTGFEPTDACETCLADSCCSQTKACFTNTPCYSFYQCASPCTTQACIDSCRQSNPTGAADYDAYASCAQSFCNSLCQ